MFLLRSDWSDAIIALIFILGGLAKLVEKWTKAANKSKDPLSPQTPSPPPPVDRRSRRTIDSEMERRLKEALQARQRQSREAPSPRSMPTREGMRALPDVMPSKQKAVVPVLEGGRRVSSPAKDPTSARAEAAALAPVAGVTPQKMAISRLLLREVGLRKAVLMHEILGLPKSLQQGP